MPWSRSSRRPVQRRILLTVLVLVLVVGAAVALTTRSSGDDGAERRAVVTSVRELVRAAAVAPERRGGVLCGRLTAGSRSRLEGLLELASSSEARRGCDVAVGEAPWRLRPITVDRERADASTWQVEVDGDRATVDRGGAGRLRLVRVEGQWQADLEEDAAWTHRLRIAEACTRAGRSAAELTPPRASRAAFRAYLEGNARILEILARRVAREPSPPGFARTDGRLVAVTRAAARRFRAGAKRVGSDPERLYRIGRQVVTREGFDVVGQLPVSVGRPFRRAVGTCYLGTGAATDPAGFARLNRICARATAPLGDVEGIDSAAAFDRYAATVRSALARLTRGLGGVLVPPGQEPVRRAVVSRIRLIARGYASLRRDVAAGRAPEAALGAEIGFAAAAMSSGLRQLGVSCETRQGTAAPLGQIA